MIKGNDIDFLRHQAMLPEKINIIPGMKSLRVRRGRG